MHVLKQSERRPPLPCVAASTQNSVVADLKRTGAKNKIPGMDEVIRSGVCETPSKVKSNLD